MGSQIKRPCRSTFKVVERHLVFDQVLLLKGICSIFVLCIMPFHLDSCLLWNEELTICQFKICLV